MKITKTHIVVGVIGLLSISAAYAYYTYKKIMDYDLGFKGIKVNSITAKLINMNVFLNFTNKANQKIEIVEQDYKVYLNDKFVTTATNKSTNVIDPKSTSVIGVNVSFDPSVVLGVLKASAINILLHPEQQVVKIDMNLKVKIWGIKFSIPYIYNITIKEIQDYYKS